MDNIYVTNKNKTMNYLLEESFQLIINEIKKEYPYNDSMCRDKYNETIQDYLYESITSNI